MCYCSTVPPDQGREAPVPPPAVPGPVRTSINVRLSLLAREKLLRFKEEIGSDSGYLPLGISAGHHRYGARPPALCPPGAGGGRPARGQEVSLTTSAVSPRLSGLAVGGTFCPSDGSSPRSGSWTGTWPPPGATVSESNGAPMSRLSTRGNGASSRWTPITGDRH